MLVEIKKQNMDLEKIKIELNDEEIKLVEELNAVKNRISDIESKNLNQDLMESIKQKSIETITIALGVSDVLEKRAHSNALEASQEYKRYQKWENTPIKERSKNFKPKYLSRNELNSLIETVKITPEYSKEIRNKYLGKEFADRKNELYSNEKSLSSKDGYTDNKNNRFDEDLSKISHVEHVSSVHEIHKDPAIQKYFNQKEKREYVNSEGNTCLTRADINISKGKKSLKETKKWAEKNQERFDLNLDKVNDKLETAEKTRKEALIDKQVFYKGKEQLKIAGSNAIKSGAKAAIGQLLIISTIEIIDEFKVKNKIGLKDKIINIKARIQERSTDIIKTLGTHSVNSFISTLLDALLNSIFKIFKNILKFIKTAFHSIIKAFKVLISKEYTKEEKLIECRKILGVTVATLIGVLLDEIIEKALITAFPFTSPFALYISPVISGLIVGVGSVLIMNSWEKYKSNFELKRLNGEKLELTEKSNKISEIKAYVSNSEANKSINLTFKVFEETLPIILTCKEHIETSLQKVKERSKIINSKIKETDKIISDTDNLLNSLELS